MYKKSYKYNITLYIQNITYHAIPFIFYGCDKFAKFF